MLQKRLVKAERARAVAVSNGAAEKRALRVQLMVRSATHRPFPDAITWQACPRQHEAVTESCMLIQRSGEHM